MPQATVILIPWAVIAAILTVAFMFTIALVVLLFRRRTAAPQTDLPPVQPLTPTTAADHTMTNDVHSIQQNKQHHHDDHNPHPNTIECATHLVTQEGSARNPDIFPSHKDDRPE